MDQFLWSDQGAFFRNHFVELPIFRAMSITGIGLANQYFTTQWGPTPFNNAGAPYGYKDRGPTSAVMALAALGLGPVPTPATAEDLISWERDAQRGFHTTQSSSTYEPMLINGLIQSGADADYVDRSLSSIDDVLDSQGVVVLDGDPGSAWGRRVSAQGGYLHRYNTNNPTDPKDQFGHWVVIFGKDNAGNYLIGDPLSRNGTLSCSPASVQKYIDSKPMWHAVGAWAP